MKKLSTNNNHLIISKSLKIDPISSFPNSSNLEPFLSKFNKFGTKFGDKKKLLKLRYLLQNSKMFKIKTLPFPIVCSKMDKSITQLTTKSSVNLSKDFSLYLSLIKKPVNLLFSIDQFLFEFSKKSYQQKKTQEFLQQLKERKKLSLFYGHLTRKQLVNLFNQVIRNKGFFSKNVFSLLERRLDVVLYRSGITKTVTEARQLIKHKKIQVNQNLINIPSFLLNPGDMISIVPEAGEFLNNQLVPNFVPNLINLERNGSKFYEFGNEKKSLNHKLRKNSPKIFGDFYSKLQKIGDKPLNINKVVFSLIPNLTKLEKKKRTQFKSKLFCKLFIQLICTRIQLRCFLELKKNFLITNSFPNLKNLEPKLSPNWNHNRNKKKLMEYEKNILTLLKGKSFFPEKNSLFIKKHYLSKSKNNQLDNLYANTGSLQKKPKFWSRNLLFFPNFLDSGYKKRSQITPIGSKFDKFGNKQEKKTLKRTHSVKKNLALYRNSFLFFFKYFKNDAKFQNLVTLSMKKFFFKKSFYKKKPSFSKNLTFRVIKPIHLEVSYNLLNIIYLYSPQRLNFPFFIDLDLIYRSLR
uniref:30S ribosomal protein S4 n=1 Tax=Chlorella variabilis TaxID=554065 RepID=A0A097P5X0_CHLVA|nr:30S ribosomal protein S4 [Chlorella variabilis]AIU38970.1 30S ribosomal protein S4 [Chlorella variabilis]AJP09429.1 30S ribosomal protein S4 [Chlorella variabilis]